MLLRKTDKDLATPLLLKLGVAVTGYFYLAGFVRHAELGNRAAMHAAPRAWAVGITINVVGFVLAVALWNMKRWAAIGLVVPALANVVLFGGVATHPALILALRLVPLIPAAVYWRKLTWT